MGTQLLTNAIDERIKVYKANQEAFESFAKDQLLKMMQQQAKDKNAAPIDKRVLCQKQYITWFQMTKVEKAKWFK